MSSLEELKSVGLPIDEVTAGGKRLTVKVSPAALTELPYIAETSKSYTAFLAEITPEGVTLKL